MIKILLIVCAVLLLAVLLSFEKKESQKGILLIKPVLSALFIVALFLGYRQTSQYFYLILFGLVFCYIGDICLVFFFRKKVFTLGLVSFLIGHLLYTAAFFYLAKTGSATWISIAATLVVGGIVFVGLKSHLGDMLIPVVAYILIISAMVVGAATLLGDTALSSTGRLMTFIGALSFYISDIFVARQRFVKKTFFNRLAGLPMYYTAQFLIAFSVGLIG